MAPTFIDIGVLKQHTQYEVDKNQSHIHFFWQGLCFSSLLFSSLLFSSLLFSSLLFSSLLFSSLLSCLFFGAVIEKMTQEELAKFLNFVYSCTSLPLSEKDWVMPFVIQEKTGSPPDDYLPVAHVIFLLYVFLCMI